MKSSGSGPWGPFRPHDGSHGGVLAQSSRSEQHQLPMCKHNEIQRPPGRASNLGDSQSVCAFLYERGIQGKQCDPFTIATAFLYERGIQGKQCDPFTIATAFIQEQCVSVSLTVPLQREQGQLLTQATTGTSSHISLHGGACIPTSKVGAWWFFLVFLGRLFFLFLF